MALKAISLFSGIGGLDYGFEAAGVSTAAAVELDAACCVVLRRNRSRWPVLEADINSLSTAEIMGAAGLRAGEADVLFGGPPCQPFSKSGYWASGDSLRLGDPRASTLAAFLRVLREARPRSFLIENVEGLGFRGKDEGLRLIMSELDAINREHGTAYSASVRVLNAADYGVPQLRRRLFIVGARDGTRFSFPEPTHADRAAALDDTRPRHVTAWDALHDVPPPDGDLRLRGKWADLLPTIPEGENYLWHTERGGGVALFGWRRRFWNFLMKIAKDRPAWTIQAQPGPATGPFHWSSRRLSAEELARLQSFPRGLSHAPQLAAAHRQMGNAVPSLLAEAIAREMRRQLLKGGPRLPASPRLAVPLAPGSPPRAETVAPVPEKYMHLVGDHAAHPGTGRGNSAAGRVAAQLGLTFEEEAQRGG